MTAYVILRAHPLVLGASGPSLSISPADVHHFQVEQAANDSVLPVAAGEHLTEYQLLEALLLPSADNIAEILARWDAGSVPAFVAKMNATARRLGMGSTTYADASGLDPRTVSTPADLIRVTEAALRLPVFAAIVAKTSAVLPVAGRVTNYNTLLGEDGIVGVKTGWTPSSGGVLVFAARRTVAGRSLMIVGAVMGQRRGYQLLTALTVSWRLVVATERVLTVQRVLTAGTVVGTLRLPWIRRPVPVVTGDLTVRGWQGLGGTMSLQWRRARWHWPAAAGVVVGRLTARFGTEQMTVPVRLGQRVPAPTLQWRLTRP